MKKLIAAFYFLFVIFPLSVSAQGIPVYDATSFAQFAQQLQEQAKEYQKQLEQLEAMTGARNAGALSNGVFEQQLRQYLPNTWQDTMNIMSASSLPAGAIGTKSIYSSLLAEYAPLTGAEAILSDPTGATAKALDRRTSTTLAAMAAGEQVFNNTEQRNQIYQELLQQVSNSPDTKNSVDIQARISAENGLAMTELMRLNAIQIQQKAAQDNEALVDLKRAAAANKYDPVKAKKAMEITP